LTGLSHPRAITRISDPIHKSIELTLFDRDLIDTNAFQRLHYVLQQSTMYASFPSNKNTRFPHSIGTSHVAGQLFASALSNAETGQLRSFLGAAGCFLEELTKYLFGTKGVTPQGASPLAEMMDAHRATISGMSRFLHRPLMPSDGAEAVSPDWRVDTNDTFGEAGILDASFIIDTLWQALKIYSLAHDIGHLPMSHAFENAIVRVADGISEYNLDPAQGVDATALLSSANLRFSGSTGLNDEFYEMLREILGSSKSTIENTITKKAVHEIRSYGILNDYLVRRQPIADCFDESFKELKGGINNYCSLIHNAALCIIYSICREQPDKGLDPKHQFLYAMRQLVDGEVDGDRLDYTLRDCHASGVDFGSFDLGRIIDNSLLVCPKGTDFAFGFGPRAVSGIEQFFEARAQSYKYLVHHRVASRSNTAVETLVEKLFVFAFIYPDSLCAEILERYDFLTRAEDAKSVWKISEILPVSTDPDEYSNSNERLDDSTLRTLLQEISRLFKSENNLAEIADDKVRHDMAIEIRSLCHVVLNRGFSNILTLYKHHSSDSFLKEIVGVKTKHDRNALIKNLLEPGELGRFFEGLRRKVSTDQSTIEQEPISFMYQLVKSKTFSPKNPKTDDLEKVVWVQPPGRKCSPISDASISTALAAAASSKSVQHGIRIYAAAKDIKTNKEVSKRAETELTSAIRRQCERYHGITF
jgi:HD superfamily phosphohydrolase